MTSIKKENDSLMCQMSAFSVLLYTVTLTRVSAYDFDQRIFRLEKFPLRGPIRLGPTWHASTRTYCANLCLNTYPNDCRSFLFNADTGNCTPGSWIRDSQPVPTPFEGALYHSFYCNESQGFSVYSKGTTRACVGIFGPKMNYIQADAACISKGAFLMSVKTVDKLAILGNLLIDDLMWVGCDSLVREHIYLWKEDGEELTNATIADVFLKGDPNDFEGSERCVCIWKEYTVLLDYYCVNEYYYACEIQIP